MFCMSIYTHKYVFFFLLLKICKVSSYLAYTIYLLLFYFKKNYYFILWERDSLLLLLHSIFSLLFRSLLGLSLFSPSLLWNPLKTHKFYKEIAAKWLFTYSNEQSLSPNYFRGKLYKLLVYLSIEWKFWKSNCWIACIYFILHACKISRRSKINCYVIK